MLFVSWRRFLYVVNLVIQQAFERIESHSYYFVETFARACEFLLAIAVQRKQQYKMKGVAL